jgi:hypothetical protein
VQDLHTWLNQQLPRLYGSSPLAAAALAEAALPARRRQRTDRPD